MKTDLTPHGAVLTALACGGSCLRGGRGGRVCRALAGLLAASLVMLPIPGGLAHLAENVGAASVRLTAEDLASVAG